MKIKRMTFKLADIYILIFNLLMIAVFDRGGSFKYVFGAFVGMILFLSHEKPRIAPRFLLLILPYLFYIVAGEILSIWNDSINKYCFEQPVLYLVPFITAMMVYLFFEDDIDRFVRLQFVAIACVFLWEGIPGVLHGTDGNLMESHYAFIFGAYFIYFVYAKRNAFKWTALLMLFLAHKRIVFMGVVMVWIAMKVFRKMIHGEKEKQIFAVFVLFCSVLLMYVGIIRSGFFSMIIMRLGINTMGRIYIYDDVSQLYTFAPSFKGTGIGYVRVVLDEIGKASFALLHNDILAMYIEIGFWGFIVFYMLYLAAFRFHYKYIGNGHIAIAVVLFIYSFINFMTDNISIYISYLYPFYLIIFSLLCGRGRGRSLSACELEQCGSRVGI